LDLKIKIILERKSMNSAPQEELKNHHEDKELDGELMMQLKKLVNIELKKAGENISTKPILKLTLLINVLNKIFGICAKVLEISTKPFCWTLWLDLLPYQIKKNTQQNKTKEGELLS